MLEELRIRGLGVIDDAVLPLGPGLTVVTGETGAGKTMVVSGLLLLFGGRADSARVRSGADQAVVDGRLEVAPGSAVATRVIDAGGALDDGSVLVLRRTVGIAGRSRAHVGGAPTPVAVLAELAERLVAVHGQADQQRLVRPAQQRQALDRFAGIDLAPMAGAYGRWRAAVREFDDRLANAAERRRETEMLLHGLREIDSVAPQPGEDIELGAAAARLAHAEALTAAARLAHDVLVGSADDPTGGADVTSLLGSARRALAQQAGTDASLDALAERLLEVAALATELGSELGSYADGLGADPEQLAVLEARRARLAALVRTYSDAPPHGLEAVAAWARRASGRLLEIDVSDEAVAALRQARELAEVDMRRLAVDLSARRQSAAAELSAAVTGELAGLAMPTARLLIEVRHRRPTAGATVVELDATPQGVGAAAAAVAVGPDGIDEVEILLQPHPATAPLPIARGASGGELSRVMLALELCLAGTDPLPTMVFDEVDAGVGGRAALEVGRRLARLSRSHQVLVVTHLAQVAAFADRHIVVDRGAAADSAVVSSDVRVVEGADRLAELARMLGGIDSATAREHAAELLATGAG